MSLSKLFQRIIWHNNTTPAINEDNLNAMSKAIDDIDDRVILIGDDVVTVIPQIQAYLEQAESIVEAVEELSQNPPYIGANGNWWVFDTTLEAYKDSGVDASITVDIADITMIAEGAQPYVTNSGTNTDPVFHLFLPRSPQGATGNGIANIAKTSTQGLVDTYTITMTDGTTYTFTVTNGQNGSGTGDMLQSDYDSNSTVKNAGGIADYVEGELSALPYTNPNLLDNPWFTVNQRGASSITTAWTYFVDRWRSGGNITEIDHNADNSITLKSGGACDFAQSISYSELPLGKSCVLSVLLSNGQVYHTSPFIITQRSTWGVFSDTVAIGNNCYLRADGDSVGFAAVITSSNVSSDLTIKAMKLELGTQSTLAHDIAPNYATELLKCQRYFISFGDSSVAEALGFGQGTLTDAAVIYAPIPVKMRAKPSIATLTGTIYLRNESTPYVITNAHIEAGGVSCVAIGVSATGATPGKPYEAFLEIGAKLELSADL